MANITWETMQHLPLPKEQNKWSSFTPTTSGFVIGKIAGHDNPRTRQLGWVYAQVGKVYMGASGGNFLYDLTSKNKQLSDRHWANMRHSFTLPVPANRTFHISFRYGSHNNANPWLGFSWIPAVLAAAVEEAPLETPSDTTEFLSSEAEKSDS